MARIIFNLLAVISGVLILIKFSSAFSVEDTRTSSFTPYKEDTNITQLENKILIDNSTLNNLDPKKEEPSILSGSETPGRYQDSSTEIYIVGVSLENAWGPGAATFSWRIRFPDVETWSTKQRQNFLGAFPEFKKPSDPSDDGFVYDIKTPTRFPPIKFVQKLLNWMSQGLSSTVTSTAAGSQNFNFLHYVWTITVNPGYRKGNQNVPPQQQQPGAEAVV